MRSLTQLILILITSTLSCASQVLGAQSVGEYERMYNSGNVNEKLAYFCEIKSVAFVDDDGTIREIKKNDNHILQHYIGSKFKVVKATGEIDGPLVSNQSLNALKTTILDKGGGLESYKVLTVYGPNTSVLYLQIDDYGSDKGRGVYRFSGYRWQEFITGICN
jgi:hypothetical protein